MISRKRGMQDAIDFVDEEPGSKRAMEGASALTSQSAGIAALCALALDSVVCDGRDAGPEATEIAVTASNLMMKCWDDLTVAASIMNLSD